MPKSKIGEPCADNKDCGNKNCVKNKCTRKSRKTTQKITSKNKKLGETCAKDEECGNKNCVKNKCTRKQRKVKEKAKVKSASVSKSKSKSKTKSPSKSRSLSNTRPKTAIIIPFRDNADKVRSKQLDQFIEYMNEYLKDVRYHIFVIEQSDDDRKFNRGKLLNIGFEIADVKGYDQFIFHDVDLLPSAELKHYYHDYSNKITHIAKVWDRYNNNPRYFGGVVSFPRDAFIRINGFPNNFWGWGGEDDELYLRTKQARINIDYPPRKNAGYFTDLENKNLSQKLTYLRDNKALKCLNKTELLKEHRMKPANNGLSTLHYKEIKRTKLAKKNTTIISVDVLPNHHWTDNVCAIDNTQYGVVLNGRKK